MLLCPENSEERSKYYVNQLQFYQHNRVVVRRQIGLRSREWQDISDDLQQVLGMLLIIRASCRCLDRTKRLQDVAREPECFVFERHFDPSSGKTSLMIYNRPARRL